MSLSEDGQRMSRDFSGRRPPLLRQASSDGAAMGVPFYPSPARVSGVPSSLCTGPASKLAEREHATADTIAGLIHDARNMVMALELYCELLEEPGVLTPSFGHYAEELRLVSGASRRLMETLAKLSVAEKRQVADFALPDRDSSPVNLLNFPESPQEQDYSGVFAMTRMQSKRASADRSFSALSAAAFQSEGRTEPATPYGERAAVSDRPAASEEAVHWPSNSTDRTRSRVSERVRLRAPLDICADRSIEDLAAELRANHNLLSALAGPGVKVGLSISGARIPIHMVPEDLTRVLVNLVRNAVEVMPGGGRIEISLEEGPQFVMLSFADSGPGIPRDMLDKVFSPGYSSHAARHDALNDALPFDPAQDRLGESSHASGVAPERKLDLRSEPKAAPASEARAGLSSSNAWPVQHRGLGLSIVRAIVTAAGGSVWASNRVEELGISGPLVARQGEGSGIDDHGREATNVQENIDAEEAQARPLTIASPGVESHGAIIHIEFPQPFAPASS